jgi:hypothetical protein
LTALFGAALAAWPAGVRAGDDAPGSDDPRAIDPAAAHALGRVLTAGPGPTGPTLLTSGGYGYTGAVLGMGDAHHRIAGALSLDERPLPWLDLVLRLDGRYDAHAVPGQASDTGMVGDPRLYARVDRLWSGGLRLGARAGLWLPGRNAPSLDASALSPELVAMASYAPPSAPIAVTANVGYRRDRSAHSAPDAAMLSAGDRLALEVSAFDAVLVGLAAAVGRGPAQGFLEASADLLVGGGAPPARTSPIFVGAGGRLAVGRDLRLEAEIEISPSQRPDISPTAPLVPIPPRFGVWLGLAYRLGAAPPAPPSSPPPPAPAAAPPPAPAAAPATITLRGHVSASDGGKLAELRVELTAGGVGREVTVDEEGRFSVDGKPGEEVTVSAEAADHLPGRATVTLRAGGANAVDLTLERRASRGQIRGLVRSLRGAAVAADILVEPETPPPDGAGEGKSLRAQDGRFQIDVAPGRYRVTISAPGYEVQKRKVDVEENGVTVLNVDLRRAQ